MNILNKLTYKNNIRVNMKKKYIINIEHYIIIKPLYFFLHDSLYSSIYSLYQ